MHYSLIRDVESLLAFITLIKEDDLLYFDTELTSLRINAKLLIISFHHPRSGKTVSIVVDSPYFDGIPLHIIREELSKLPRIRGIAHNWKFDAVVFEHRKLPEIPAFADTALMVHVYDPDKLKNLETRVKEDLGYEKKKYKDIIKKNWDKIDWVKDVASGLIKLEELAEYAAEDVFWGYELYTYYQSLLDKEPQLQKIHDNIEVPFSKVLRDMKLKGIRIDTATLRKIDRKLAVGLKTATDAIYEEAGCVFNMNAPKQKADVLFKKLGLPPVGKTKTGADSTDADTLEVLAAQGYKIAQLMLDYASLQKLFSGYTQSIPSLIDEDGRLRCDFNADGTRTGRLSSSNPNLQNQPNNDKYPIRKSFIASEGKVLLIADYSQIEPRIMAHLSKDPKMISIYKEAGDIYIGIAQELGIVRKEAKVVQLAISYGLGPDKLARSLNVSTNSAKDIIKLYYQKYKFFSAWKTGIEKYAEKHGHVVNMFGRIRRLPNAKKPHLRGLYFTALRQAVNTVVQGSAADFLKISMIKLWKTWEHKDADILLQVHDELVCESFIASAQERFEEMCHIMENTTTLLVPIKAEGKICSDWSQMKDDTFKGLDLANYVPPIIETPSLIGPPPIVKELDPITLMYHLNFK